MCLDCRRFDVWPVRNYDPACPVIALLESWLTPQRSRVDAIAQFILIIPDADYHVREITHIVNIVQVLGFLGVCFDAFRGNVDVPKLFDDRFSTLSIALCSGVGFKIYADR